MSDSTTILKQCSKRENCIHPEQKDGGWLPATPEYFHINNSVSCGLQAKCKVCRSIYLKERYEENPEREQYRIKKYNKSEKGKLTNRKRSHIKYWENPKYHRDASSKWAKNHREHNNALRRQKRRENPQKFRDIERAAKAKRRALKNGNGGKHSRQDILNQYLAQKGMCYYCESKLKKKYHVDHVIPLSRGGSNDKSNLVCTCRFCNLSKKDKTLREWIEKIEDIELYIKIAQKIIERESIPEKA